MNGKSSSGVMFTKLDCEIMNLRSSKLHIGIYKRISDGAITLVAYELA